MEFKKTMTEKELREYITQVILYEPIFSVADLMTMGVVLKKAAKK